MRDTHKRPTASKLEFKIRNMKAEDWEGAQRTVCLANGLRAQDGGRWLGRHSVAEMLERFPEGQFVAVVDDGSTEQVIGVGITMRTSRTPLERPLNWFGMIGSYGLANNDPRGKWLYGVELAVHPGFQRRGVASALYKARLGLVGKLGLRGWYAGGMLMGYHAHQDTLSPRDYYEKVLAGELVDPTVSMQMNRGLRVKGLIENYCESAASGNNAALLVWTPPIHVRPRKKPAAAATPTAGARN